MNDFINSESVFTGTVLICAVIALSLAALHWRQRNSIGHLIVKLLILLCLSALSLTRKVVPYRPLPPLDSWTQHALNGCLEILWWFVAARVAVESLRLFVVLGQRPRESKLMQDILAALVYAGMAFAIIANVFELPVRGLLATSGALAIILGLALQSSLGDVFSGIVLDLERPYHVGDWIIVDDGVKGSVIETNWRSTHILTPNNDVAVLPNSVIAKAKLINCSAPTKTHGATLRIRLDASHTPSRGCNLLREVLLGSTNILRSPEPSVAIQQLDADCIEYELSFSVSDVGVLGSAQNEIFDRISQATAAVGIALAPRLGASVPVQKGEQNSPTPESLLAELPLFATLSDSEKSELARHMLRKDYKSGEIVVSPGTVLNALSIISDGVLLAIETSGDTKIERARLTPGAFFGEMGLLTGKPAGVEVTALTRATVYEIAKDAVAPLLKARPAIAEELGTVLAYRQLLRHSVLDTGRPTAGDSRGLVDRLSQTIQQLFSSH